MKLFSIFEADFCKTTWLMRKLVIILHPVIQHNRVLMWRKQMPYWGWPSLVIHLNIKEKPEIP